MEGVKKVKKVQLFTSVTKLSSHSKFLVGAQFRNSRLKLVLDSLFFQAVKSPIRANLISEEANRLLKETVIVYDIIFHISTQAQKRATFYRALLRSVSSVVDVKKCIRLLLY